MKLTQLRYVTAIAERGSLRAAARHLSVAQPAVSRDIGAIERERVGNYLQHQKADARREVVRKKGGCFKGLEGFRYGGVQDDNLHRGCEGYDGSRLCCHTSRVFLRA